MFEKISNNLLNWVNNNNPWTNVYGLARTLIALSTALTLGLNRTEIFFRPGAGNSDFPNCENTYSAFCLVSNSYLNLTIIKWIFVILLLIIASGWRPRYTGIVHWYIAYSFQTAATTIDGGEQVAAVITFMLIPLTLTDNRKWHWYKPDNKVLDTKSYIYRIIALVTIWAIRIQVAILYLHSTIAKLGNSEWINGTAVYYFLQDHMLGLPNVLLNLISPILTSKYVAMATWGTMVLQIMLFAALVAPKKHWKYYLTLALLMHETIAVMLGLISFSMVMTGVLILYLRPAEKPIKSLYKAKEIFVPLKLKGVVNEKTSEKIS
ncbi:sporulation-delaying protein SdpB family protein [Bacillus mycoides]|uniref:sporulation-delaying protein SdpB family protein n=1 Tax=Bacillus mycoides TaxID=1405 RepID=UPI003D221FA2